MNSKSKKLGTGFIVLLTAVCFIPAVAGAFTPGDERQERGLSGKGCHRPALGIWRNPQLVQELELTEEQVKELRDADFTFREKRLALRAQLNGLRLQLEKAFSEDLVDNAAVLPVAEKISDVQGKRFVQDIESRLALGKILKADQIKKLRQHEMQPRKQGPRPGEKRIPRLHKMERPDEN